MPDYILPILHHIVTCISCLCSSCSIFAGLVTAAPLFGTVLLQAEQSHYYAVYIFRNLNVFIEYIKNDLFKWCNCQFSSSVTKCKCVHNVEYLLFEINGR